MEIKELYMKLGKIGLGVVWDIDLKHASVGIPEIANPLLWFDAYTEEYQGNVRVKSINVPLFSEVQIREALLLVDEFLQTPLQRRNLSSNLYRRELYES